MSPSLVRAPGSGLRWTWFFAIAGALVACKRAAPAIAWTPSSFEKTVVPLKTDVGSIPFEAVEEVPNLTDGALSVSWPLRDYLRVTLVPDPASLEGTSLPKKRGALVSYTLFVPAHTPPGVVDGTVQLCTGKGPCQPVPAALPVKLTILADASSAK